MPSEITHALFTEQAYRRAFDSLPETTYSWLVQGSAGPDPFFSARKRRPSAEAWAHRIHDEGYGRFCAAMAGRISRVITAGEPEAEAQEAFFLGFCTHAVLDRAAHPLVNYLSGWVDPMDPDTRHLHLCHPFMERILDMIVLRDLRGMDPAAWKHSRRLPSPEEAGRVLAGLLAGSILESYPAAADESGPEELEEALRNAFLDDGDFHHLYNPAAPAENRRLAAEMEKRGEVPPRILALFYPDTIPAGDFLNEDGAGWLDPRTGEKRRDSIMDLFNEAIRDAAGVLETARAVVRDGENPEGLSEILGNGDLDDPSPASGNVPLVHCDPMEISPLIDGMYAGIGVQGELGLSG